MDKKYKLKYHPTTKEELRELVNNENIILGEIDTSNITDMAFFGELLAQNGWTSLTAVNMLVFTVMHWPCATTLLSVKKESRSLKWATAAFLTPAAAGILICAINTFIYRFFL